MTKILTLIYINTDKFFLIISGYTFIQFVEMLSISPDVTKAIEGKLHIYVLLFTALFYLLRMLKDSFEWLHQKKMRKKQMSNAELEEVIKKMRIERRRNDTENETLLGNDYLKYVTFEDEDDKQDET